jgi:hypothetical protein
MSVDAARVGVCATNCIVMLSGSPPLTGRGYNPWRAWGLCDSLGYLISSSIRYFHHKNLGYTLKRGYLCAQC